MIPTTCKGCTNKSHCNGKTSRGSPNCKRLLAKQPMKKGYGYFLRLFNGNKSNALLKYLKKENNDTNTKC